MAPKGNISSSLNTERFGGKSSMITNGKRHGKKSVRSVEEKLSLSNSSSYAEVRSAYGSSSPMGQKELIIKHKFFFDHDGAEGVNTTSVGWKLSQDSILSSDGSAQVISRPMTAKVYCLPRASNAQVASTSYLAYSGVRSVTSSGGKTIIGTSQQVVKPDFDTEWILVNSINYETLFDTSNAIPFTTGSSDGGTQELFRVTCVNTDDGSDLLDPVQFMVELTTAQAMTFLPEVITSVALMETPSNDPAYSSTDRIPALASFSHVRNVD